MKPQDLTTNEEVGPDSSDFSLADHYMYGWIRQMQRYTKSQYCGHYKETAKEHISRDILTTINICENPKLFEKFMDEMGGGPVHMFLRETVLKEAYKAKEARQKIYGETL